MSRTRAAQKSESAFRTISEVSDRRQIPQHVLRFWETKFAQVQPMKRGGGRRYYRPEDIELLRRIRDCLYADGYTIKGVQKLLREGQIAADLPPQVKTGRSGDAHAATSGHDPSLAGESHADRTNGTGRAGTSETAGATAMTSESHAETVAALDRAAAARLSPQTRAVLEDILHELEDARATLVAAVSGGRAQ